MRLLFMSLVSLSLIGCSISQLNNHAKLEGEIPSPPEIKNLEIGAWKNIHSNSSDLAGVLVQQFPDCPYEAPAWEGKHPAMILYVMWNGRVNQVGYEPSGKIAENFWWNLNDGDRDYSYIWEQLDFSHGSDPNFKCHHDPRTRKDG